MKRKNQIIALTLGILVVGCLAVFPIRTNADTTKQIMINDDDTETSTRDVVLEFNAPTGVTLMRVSESYSPAAISWSPYRQKIAWTLSRNEGTKTVFVQFRYRDGSTTEIYKDTITLVASDDTDTQKAVINGGETSTKSRKVTLSLTYNNGTEDVFISNTREFAAFNRYEPTAKIEWTLTKGGGEKTVYVQFMKANGDYQTVQDTIDYEEQPDEIPGGTIVRSPDSQMYYIGFDGQIHPFLHASVFHSWFDSISETKIRTVTNVELRQYQVGKSVCIRGGTWLVKFGNLPQMYAVELGCRLVPLLSDVEAQLIYGEQWRKRVVVLSEIESANYTILNRGVEDKDNDIIDKDNDGVDALTEDMYGSNDRLPDSDGDGLSDVEEIAVWFTDPIDSDTDNDGMRDKEQVLTEFLPGITKKEDRIGTGVYRYPGGLLIHSRDDDKYYMSHVDGFTYYMSRRTSDNIFTSNHFDTTFVVPSSPQLSFTVRSGWYVQPSAEVLMYPSLITTLENLYVL
ncbi:MAG: hypothetical protein CO030_05175 [Candidatus Magasanikbacteria bacterium CG_4_9_14_0_2_um_filter_42_11]|uniref:Uncharacterized protein n=1 Tax=Candidatus Magasanikbacteria bacterium CG_4_9_14_0_2_um_filter_42_11 TaxID=1974643 RepID=A0A2M8F8D9_9BACT|nr:MAG: hypothetical protein COU34_00665 [Candidatus Magasanikbacteria bacterium CG10_big_fil_rev_8_21_14_0_10_43_9]PIY92200.1 MAG: hypothetical protein COY70_04530 [Candidatus Magasanikbacteria bacterium CG_4_10_14_0_8_um_filter_42_12]PJC51995.1 MAG: hypothetical protein CO030_05175 [Candidatus Magasanikbacteria bacterium CG_4_9_14_0_2_um_filter_42_11]